MRAHISLIAALFLTTGTAHATDIYSIRCDNQLFTVYGHHGYEFTRGETRCGKLLPERLFRLHVTALGSFAVTDANM